MTWLGNISETVLVLDNCQMQMAKDAKEKWQDALTSLI